jgi:hypothetical protein
MEHKQNNDLKVESGLEAAANLSAGMTRETHYHFELVRAGTVVEEWDFKNLVVTEGLNDSLDKQFKAVTYTASWFVGLTGNTPSFVAGDTMASHAGWTEVSNYDAATRPALTLGTVSAGSVNNSASKASYTISSGGANVGGAFIVTNSTKGGSTGILYGGGAFSQNRALLQDDILNVTITLTATAA